MIGYRILAVDDDPALLDGLTELLHAAGYEVDAVPSAEAALERLRRKSYHLVITDLVMPGRCGIELIRTIREHLPEAAVLLVTGNGHLQAATSAIKSGTIDYLTKPFEPSRLLAMVARALEGRTTQPPERLLPMEEVSRDGIVSRSPVMRAVFEKIAVAATIDAAILIRAESGSGKELIARAIHRRSARSHRPFLAIHAGAIPQERMGPSLFGENLHDPATPLGGRFAQAAGGTIFLDEVDALDSRSQLHLLHLLTESSPETARVVAATGRDLQKQVRDGRFREDLYFRLAAFPIDLPPLRERREDIPLLVDAFIKSFAERYKKAIPLVAPASIELLSRYPWPGNVRELRSVIEHAVILCTGLLLGPEFLPRMIHRDEPPQGSIQIAIGTRMKEVERTVIARTLDAFAWNKNQTAKVLGISRRSLYNKLERYQIMRPRSPGASGFEPMGETAPAERELLSAGPPLSSGAGH